MGFSKGVTVDSSRELIIHWETSSALFEIYTLDRLRWAFEYLLLSSNTTYEEVQPIITKLCLPTGEYGLYLLVEPIHHHDSYVRIDQLELGNACVTQSHAKG